MALIGRENEVALLEEAAASDHPELVVVYGRRRVGKTYLVNETFRDRFAFSHAGLSPTEMDKLKEESKSKTKLSLQLEHFHHSLLEYGYHGKKAPRSWLEAFHFLALLLNEKKKEGVKPIVFLDELPWMDTPKSFFLTALESFCNGYLSREKALLVVAGSGISYILRKVLVDHGGLYGRVSKQILLAPFSLFETELLLKENHVHYSRYDVARAYMAFGGMPYYLRYLDPRYSLPENIDRLLFKKEGPLREEFDRLFASSFDNDKLTATIVRVLSSTQIGLTREEIRIRTDSKEGEVFSLSLNALESSGFLVKYSPLQEKSKDLYYKLIDPFCLFYLRFVEGNHSLDAHFFSDNESGGRVNAWKGFAFENLCYNHLEQIKAALGIKGVSSSRFSFHYKGEGTEDGNGLENGEKRERNRGAQIDLILERKDNIVDLCEMKFYSDLYPSTEEDELSLRRKKTALSRFLKKKQSIQTVLITTFGIAKGKHQWAYQNVITLSDLFEKAE